MSADALRSFVAEVRRRWMRARALRTAGLACLLAAVPLVLVGLVARAVTLRGAAGFAAAVAGVAASACALTLALRRAWRRPSDEATARFIEEQSAALGHGRLDEHVVSAIGIAAPGTGNPDSFGGFVIEQALARVDDLPADTLVPSSAIRRAALGAASGTAVLAGAFILAWPVLAGAVLTARLSLFPGTIVVSVQPGDVRVVAGGPLRIDASVSGVSADALDRLDASLVVSAGGEQRTVAMIRDGGRFRFAIESVDRSFAYKVVAGRVESRSHNVTALFPARIQRIELQYEYPSFSGLQPRVDSDGGDIYGPAGTRVRVRVHADKELNGGELALSRGAAVPLRRAAASRVAEASLTLTTEASYRVNVTDVEGLQARGATEYFIRLLDDRPPEVRILRPSSDAPITPLQEVAIEARADDDHGIARFDLVYAVAGRKERVVPFSKVTGTNVARAGVYLLSAEDLDVQPGDVVSYYARAVDVGRGKRATEARSDIFFLEVKPFSEEFVAAQSQAGASGAAGAQLEALIAAQKEIINATWSLERRSAAGRSEEDAHAVAQAQAELKTRLELMRSVPRRRLRGVFPPPQQIQPRPPAADRAGPDPLAAALEAMTHAQDALQQQRTGAALPHELAALRGLLQAQAEVRRREVQQSAAAPGQGGTSRIGQDLSALFDRELQRQQRTNYESRSQIEERTDRERTTALDRIRDLARRQEDLSRRQRELADDAKLSDEERKRQLEKLTREQEALREEAEALRTEAGALGGVADQMRAAASDLQRQDARSAAEKGAAAAQGLRRAEGQMHAGSAEARERTAGELQVEAQQIAEAQRRIAEESARTPAGSAAGRTGAEGVAQEKDRLAARIDALEQAARRLAEAGTKAPRTRPSAAGEDPAARARAAAEVLQREKAAARMRDSARELRQPAGANGSSAPRSSENEQQLARTLDRAAAALGGGAASDAALGERLDQTRAMRESLNKLEKQLREAERREAANPSSKAAQAGSEGRSGREGRQGSSGNGAGGELQRLREEYRRELERTREALGRLESEGRSGHMLTTPETHEFSQSSPGNEAFKQDHSEWESLRRNVDLAMERYEAAVSRRLVQDERDRLDAGGSDRVPEAYRESIARYYRSLARKP